MKLEALTLADADALVALDAVTNIHPWTPPLWRDTIKQQQVVGMRNAKGALTGAAVISRTLDQAELLMIAVAPAEQGKGLGRALLEAILVQLGNDGVVELFLEVRASNLRAQALYQGAGANEIGQRRNYYPCAGGREDAHLYAFYLSAAA
ncbi:ribosomal-protein-alanine N-acetyltransferase [Andreprevotia lacus DSM 23236]|uniref:[Ribosomal protein bS18]-alanine N-acetyltransferase n=1 Tax=Andreprevotia lacus DSM 23236 TaxID=1121001 RepID=A0A1W1XCZ5_9NEIS|nr:ribosomal protein S18-alanine N-acetyltransferase [Andreprevotia lacus]SMC21796.1 ribosomal-protein-alanine N-acetyltransferase [Andreprevotia lacus DSM 23236]